MLVISLEMRWERTFDERGTAVVGDLHNTIYPDNLEYENTKAKYKILKSISDKKFKYYM